MNERTSQQESPKRGLSVSLPRLSWESIDISLPSLASVSEKFLKLLNKAQDEPALQEEVIPAVQTKRNQSELHFSIVDIGEVVHTLARQEANERLEDILHRPERSLKNVALRAYYSLSEEYHRQKFHAKARERIVSGIGQEGNHVLNADETTSIIRRIESIARGEFSNSLAGDHVLFLDDSTPSLSEASKAVRKLYKWYIDETLDKGIIDQSEYDRHVEIAMHAVYGTPEWKRLGRSAPPSRLFQMDILEELIEKVRAGHLEREDAKRSVDEADIVLARAQFLNFETRRSAGDKVIEVLERIPVLRSIAHPAVAGIVASSAAWMGTRAWSTIARIAGVIGGGALAAGGIAALKQHKKINDTYEERMQKFALGVASDSNNQDVNGLVSHFGSDIPSASDLVMLLKGGAQRLSGGGVTGFEAAAGIAGEVRTRLNMGLKLKADFIKWDSPRSIENTRLDLLQELAMLEAALEEALQNLPADDREKSRNACEAVRTSTTQNLEGELTRKISDGKTALRTIRSKACRQAFLKGALVGGGIGALTSIASSILQSGSAEAATGAKEKIGHGAGVPKPSQSHAIPHSEPSPEAPMPSQPRKISTDSYLDNLEKRGVRVERISRVGHYTNNTPHSDGNELRLRNGGVHGTGITRSGDFELDVSSMKTGGSRIGGAVPNIESLRASGHLKALVTLDSAHQNRIISFDIDPETGKVLIPKDHPAADAIFEAPTRPGQAVHLKAKFMEIAEMVTDKNGTPKLTHDGRALYRILATDVGKGVTTSDLKTPTARPVVGNLIAPLIKLPRKKNNIGGDASIFSDSLSWEY